MKRISRIVVTIFCLCIMLVPLSINKVSADNITVVIDDEVNVRSGPSTSYSVVYTTPKGKNLTATSDGTSTDSSGNTWYHVTIPNSETGSGDKTGYVIATYITVKEETPTATITYITIGGSYVNVRHGPSTNYSKLYTTPGYSINATSDGTVVNQDGETWYHVIIPASVTGSNEVTGYAYSQYVTVIDNPSDPVDNTEYIANSLYPSIFTDNNKIVIVTADGNVNVRSAPTTSSTAIAEVWPCAMVTTGTETNASGEKWYKVKTPGGLDGYIRSDLVSECGYTLDQDFEKVIAVFPRSYWNGLRYLHTLYPGWRFEADKISMTLDYAASQEKGKKLISNVYTSLPETWRTSSGQTTVEPGYKYASKYAISFVMNPENFITPAGIFMFMHQGYDSATQNYQSVKKIVSGTFLDTDTYINAIVTAGAESGVNPDVLAGLILQEQGSTGSALCLGTYPGYEGYYNFYNFSASGATTEQIITSGLSYAKSQGWDTIQKALSGGAKKYGSDYVNSGQYTHYYKDYNVYNGTFWHQYATNFVDHIQNANKLAKSYLGDHSSTVTFKIPVFSGSGGSTHSHAYSAWSTVKAATCTEPGTEQRVCACGAKETRTVSALGHNFSSTLGFDGSYHWYTCSRCNEISGKSAHTYSAWTTVTPNSCTENGEEKRYCTVCGKEETRTVLAAGHKFGEWTRTVDPTCYYEGEEQRVCANCNTVEKRKIAKVDHNYLATWTFSSTGHWHRCEYCGMAEEVFDHTFGDVTITKNATCTEKGEGIRTCTVCGKKETVTFEILPHTFGTWSISKDDGEFVTYERKCSVCGKTEQKIYKKGSKNPDVNGDGTVTDQDAIYLLFHFYFPDDYPAAIDCDFNGDGQMTDQDAIYLLFYFYFPDKYPIE
ncbi:MAG: SH3 domain-containing protein [Clostridia bacterium]|nr:SH3 domain-containing protein [Clostridia bacterium]